MAMAKERKKRGHGRAHQEAKLRRSFGWVALLGVVLVVAGLVGLVYVGVATVTSVLLFGWLLLIGGVVGLLHAVQSRKSNFFWLALVVAALNIAAGVVLIRHPADTAAELMLFAALLFLAGGIFRLFGGLVVRGPQLGWTVLQGAFGILLGVLVLADWPESSLYTIGAYLSLSLLFDGLGLMAMGTSGRRVVSMVAEGQTTVRGGQPGRGSGTGDAARGSAGDTGAGASRQGRGSASGPSG